MKKILLILLINTLILVSTINGSILEKNETNNELCNLTYNLIKNNITIYSQIDNFPIDLIRIYNENWQDICSDNINKTLQPEFVCQKIYYAYINNKDYNMIKNEIINKINISDYLLNYYISNYNKLCYNVGYSSKIVKNINIIKINETQICDIHQNEDDLFLPLFDIYLGNIDCDLINNFGMLFKFKIENNNLMVNGVRFIIILIPLLIFIIYELIKSTTLLNKMTYSPALKGRVSHEATKTKPKDI